jgi:hypothetical protein
MALTDGYHLALWIAFGLVVAAIAAATMLRPERRPAPAPRPADQLEPARQLEPAEATPR